ncbi:MAG: glycosyltransferase family 2 protein [Chloroflexota bacterium]|nr:glycosyltransferase family 2 protein [Chloroflexota bacterium]
MSDLAEISVIIVNWNVRDLLDKCLASLFQAQDAGGGKRLALEIIVVDCNSQDASVAMVRERYPGVKLLPQGENIGFTRGNNLGMAAAAADTLLLLNPDTEVCKDTLMTMLEFMRQRPDTGILGPHTLNTDGSHQSTRRRFPTLLTGIFESSWLSALAPAGLFDSYFIRDTADDDILEVDWAQGSALMLRRAVLQDIGGLDEGFVMYSEELDFCKRAKDAGWKVIYHGGAKIMHHGGKSSEQVAAFKQIQFHSSKLRYFRKHHGYPHYALLRALLLAQFCWQLVLELGKACIGHKVALRRQRIKTYWRVLRDGLKAEV